MPTAEEPEKNAQRSRERSGCDHSVIRPATTAQVKTDRLVGGAIRVRRRPAMHCRRARTLRASEMTANSEPPRSRAKREGTEAEKPGENHHYRVFGALAHPHDSRTRRKTPKQARAGIPTNCWQLSRRASASRERRKSTADSTARSQVPHAGPGSSTASSLRAP